MMMRMKLGRLTNRELLGNASLGDMLNYYSMPDIAVKNKSNTKPNNDVMTRIKMSANVIMIS